MTSQTLTTAKLQAKVDRSRGKLILSSSRVTDLTPLAGPSNLIHLYLMDTEATDLTPLAGLTGLAVYR